MADAGFDQVAYLRDVKKVMDAIRRHGKVAEDAAGRGMREGGEEVMTVSKELFVPVDTGALKSSGHVTGPERTKGGDLQVRLSYGGPAGGSHAGVFVGYALYVHEDLEAHHVVGGPKYLSQPVEQMKGRVVEHMTNLVRAAVG
jgi:hypothetical protein